MATESFGSIILPVGSSSKSDRIAKNLGALSFIIDKGQLAVGNGYSYTLVGGVTSFLQLQNIPFFNGVKLAGMKTGRDYHLVDENRIVFDISEAIGFYYMEQAHTEGAEADKPSEGYYYATDAYKWFKDGVEFTPLTTQPEPSLDTKDKLYVTEEDDIRHLWLGYEGASDDKVPSAKAVREKLNTKQNNIGIGLSLGTTAKEGDWYWLCDNYTDSEGNYHRKGFYRHNGIEWIEVDKKAPYKQLSKRKDYLADIVYDQENIVYDIGKKFFKDRFLPNIGGGCSSVRNGNMVGRNFDWTYDKNNTFHILTNSGNGRYASMATCGFTGLTKDMVESGAYDERYWALPFLTVDGMNEKGVYININVVPKDKGNTRQTEEGKEELCAVMVPRLVLDYAATASEAVSLIQNYNIYATSDNEYHFMICDATSTYIVEFINNVTTVIEDKYIMTNFHLHGVEFDSDGNIDWDTVEDHGQGLERYALIKDLYDTASTKAGMQALMRELFYTKAYSQSDPLAWKTEFTGNSDITGDITIRSTDEKFMERIEIARDRYENRSRDDSSPNFGTWQTVHSIVYDLLNKRSIITVQEGDVGSETEYKFIDGQVNWGDIGGSLDNQADLKQKFLEKANNTQIKQSITEGASDNDIAGVKAVNKELLDNSTSQFEYVEKTGDNPSDTIELKIKNKNNATKIEKTIDFGDKLLFEKKSQSFENKDIDAEKNNVSNIKTSNFKEGVLQTEVRDKNTASDESVASEKAVRTELNKKVDKEAGKSLVDDEDIAQITTNKNDIADIQELIPSAATPTNKLIDEAKVDEKISLVEAKHLYKTSSQGSFATKAELNSATTFYNADGTTATPTKNDIVYVLADETRDGACTKYVYASKSGTAIVWGFVIKVSDKPFTQAQLDAINSGATKEKIDSIEDKVDKEDGKSLVDDDDIAQITENKNDIADLNENKADKEDTYTKDEVDTKLDKKVDIEQTSGTEGQILQLNAQKKLTLANITDYILVTTLPTSNIKPRFYNLSQPCTIGGKTYGIGLWWHDGTEWKGVGSGGIKEVPTLPTGSDIDANTIYKTYEDRYLLTKRLSLTEAAIEANYSIDANGLNLNGTQVVAWVDLLKEIDFTPYSSLFEEDEEGDVYKCIDNVTTGLRVFYSEVPDTLYVQLSVRDTENNEWCTIYPIAGGTGGGNIISVNGKVGVVVLKPEDIGTTYYIQSASNFTFEGETIPLINALDITECYDAISEGHKKGVLINKDSNDYYDVIRILKVSGNKAIEILYNNNIFVKYIVNGTNISCQIEKSQKKIESTTITQSGTLDEDALEKILDSTLNYFVYQGNILRCAHDSTTERTFFNDDYTAVLNKSTGAYEVKENATIINASSNTTINTYTVPQLTSQNVIDAYDKVMAGKNVVIADATNKLHLLVNQANLDSTNKCIVCNFQNIMTLIYNQSGLIVYRENIDKTWLTNTIRELALASDEKIPTEKAVIQAILNKLAGVFKIMGSKATKAEILALTGTVDMEAWICLADSKVYYCKESDSFEFKESNAVPIFNLSAFVPSTDQPKKLYCTDESGNQTTVDFDSVGKVDDITLDGTSMLDENKQAHFVSADTTHKGLVQLAQAGDTTSNNKAATPFMVAQMSGATDISGDFKNDTYNKNLYTFDSVSMKVLQGICIASFTISRKVPTTDIVYDDSQQLRLPALPGGLAYPPVVRVSVLQTAGQYTCMRNKNAYWVAGGSEYEDPAHAFDDTNFFIGNFTKIENAYSDAAHTQPINICAQQKNSIGHYCVDYEGMPLLTKHNVYFTKASYESGGFGETIYRPEKNTFQKYIEVTQYYDEHGVLHEGEFYMLEVVNSSKLAPDWDYLYKCRLIHRMQAKDYDYIVNQNGVVCTVAIAEDAVSKEMSCNQVQDHYFSNGIKGTITFTPRVSLGSNRTMDCEIDSNRYVKFGAGLLINKITVKDQL